jgi:hypothetical protein
MNSIPTKDIILEFHSILGKSRKTIVKMWQGDTNNYQKNKNLETSDNANGELEYLYKSVKYSLDLLRKAPFFMDYYYPNTEYSILKFIGESLFNFLPVCISSTIKEEYKSAKVNEHLLRIKIVTNELGFIDLPWELLYSNETDFLSLNKNIIVMRYLPASVSLSPLLVALPIKVLFIITNPNDTTSVNPTFELNAIKDNMDTNKFQRKVLYEPTVKELNDELSTGKYHIVHYIGHGGLSQGEGNLILNNHNNKTYWLSSQELATILPNSVRLLCLSTCFTAKNYQIESFNMIGQTRASYNLPNMVVNQFPLSEQGVRLFWKTFYDSLGEHGMLDTAILNGRTALLESNPSSGDWSSFVLHLRNNNKIFTISSHYQKLISNSSFKTEVDEVKGLEIQANLFSSILNNLKSQANAFVEPPEALLKAIEETQKHHTDIVNKHTDLTRNLGIGDE